VRTTIDVPEAVLERLKVFAAETGRRLNDVVNDALLALVQDQALGNTGPAETPLRRLPTFGSSVLPGLLPGLDPNRYADLAEALDLETEARWVAERSLESKSDDPARGPEPDGPSAGRRD